jgi:hypothetical protein
MFSFEAFLSSGKVLQYPSAVIGPSMVFEMFPQSTIFVMLEQEKVLGIQALVFFVFRFVACRPRARR